MMGNVLPECGLDEFLDFLLGRQKTSLEVDIRMVRAALFVPS